MDDHARPVFRTLIATGAGLAVFGMLAACSSGNGSTSSTTASASTAFSTIPIQTTTTPAPAAAGQGGGGSASTAAGDASGTYTVVSGDYPIGVAKKLGVTLQALLDANGMTLSSFNLVPGQKLKIPSATTGSTTASTAAGSPPASGATGSTASTAASTTTTLAPDAPGTYTVRAGDAWSLIASRLGVDVNDLAAFNDKTLNSVLIPGMKLKVPPPRTTTTTVKP
jgi:LysM repeat protein